MKTTVDFWVLLGVLFMFCWYMGFMYGSNTSPKVCAKVMGMTPVYSTADECTYIMGTQGRAYWKYLAVQEGRK